MMYSNISNTAIDTPYMLGVAEKKFVLGHKTMELMADAHNDAQRFIVAVVGLLEVEESLRFSGMDDQEAGFIQEYHRLVQSYLDDRRGKQGLRAC